jgi:hypothetical protein
MLRWGRDSRSCPTCSTFTWTTGFGGLGPAAATVLAAAIRARSMDNFVRRITPIARLERFLTLARFMSALFPSLAPFLLLCCALLNWHDGRDQCCALGPGPDSPGCRPWSLACGVECPSPRRSGFGVASKRTFQTFSSTSLVERTNLCMGSRPAFATASAE